LHFDNLYHTSEVDHYWRRLLLNLKDCVMDAAARNDHVEYLTALGVSLHAIQDFYAHSNWCEQHPRLSADEYRSVTWATDHASSVQFHTGKYEPYPSPPPLGAPDHGGYDDGLNKDSQIRPRWDEAYVFAYIASRQLIE